MDVRPFSPDDVDAVKAFLARIPPGESAFFKEDITAPDTVEQWVSNPSGLRFVAVDDGEVLGYTAVIPGVGWSSHVGDVRLVVDPTRRRAGVGRTLARRALVAALEAGLRKLVVEVVADQEPAIQLFSDLGFRPEAMLTDQVQDRNGELHDLMVLGHDVEDVRSTMETVGITDAVNG
jgi:ribosomal protein S18 acetylase RimI-like enzyme